MELAVKKWGNSLGIILPNAFIKQFKLEAGSKLELIHEKDGMKLIPKLLDRKGQLDLLLAQITSENIPSEGCFGEDVGKEKW